MTHLLKRHRTPGGRTVHTAVRPPGVHHSTGTDVPPLPVALMGDTIAKEIHDPDGCHPFG